jgi:hypothetical protein
MGAKINEYDDFPSKPRSVNQLLSRVDSALQYERKQCPGLFGAGVMDYGEVFEKLTSFQEKQWNNTKRLYVVRLDFTKCYDRVNQDKMLEILEEVATYVMCVPECICFSSLRICIKVCGEI